MSEPAVSEPAATGRRLPRGGVGWLSLPALLVLVALFVLPLSRLFVDSVQTDTGLNLTRYIDLFHDGLFWPIMGRTVRLSLIVTFAAALIGYPIAYTAARLPRLWAAVVLACVALPFFTSTLVRSYAWRALLADNGVINDMLVGAGLFDRPRQLVFNDLGIVIGMTQVLLPMLVLPTYAVMKGIDRSLTNAARGMGASPFAAWRTVFLPQSMSGLAAGASLVFISSLGYYTTPALLGGPSTPMIAQRIDVQINTQQEYGPTAAQAVIMLIGVVILMVLLRRPLGLSRPGGATHSGSGLGRWLGRCWAIAADALANRLLGGAPGRAGVAVGAAVSRVRHVIVGALAAFGLVLLVGPQVVVVLLAFNSSDYLSFPPTGYSTRWYGEYFNDEYWRSSTLLSLGVAVVAGLIATAVGVLCAFAVARWRRRRLATGVYLLSMAPLVMPPIILAVGLFFTFARIGLLGSPTGLVLAYVVLGVPYVLITSQGVVAEIDPLYERAAASMGASPWRRARTIVAPLIAPAVVSSFLFSVIMAFDDLVIGVFLGSAETVTLQVRMYQDIQFEISPKVAAVGVVVTSAMLLTGMLVMTFNRLGLFGRARRGGLPGMGR
ncbi:hypothetical protein GCM10010191_73370 [Actinomadura vinacea]|uniref:ABC transmembrane type-1 domain-containing protein n=1 Tax=Actinomadura vinacea TaxID=115336 RepID=A0ABN3K1M5_9ACTN